MLGMSNLLYTERQRDTTVDKAFSTGYLSVNIWLQWVILWVVREKTKNHT